MAFSVLRIVSYFAAILWDRSLWRMRWAAYTPRQQYLAQVLVLCVLICITIVAAFNATLLTTLGFICEVTGLVVFISTCWRLSPMLNARLRQRPLLTAAIFAVNAIAIYKMPAGQRTISMATSSIVVFAAYVILSKLGRVCFKVCCCCLNCCKDVCTDAGELPKLPPIVS